MTRKVKAMGQREKGEAFLALADRCEREEPSRALDDAIWEALEGRPAYTEGEPFKRGNPPRRTRLPIPAYTASLNAAVTLIGDGVEWDMTTLYGVARASVGLNLNKGPHYGKHYGALVPMTICAAALRARAALKEIT